MPKHGPLISKEKLRCLIMTIMLMVFFSCNLYGKDKNMDNNKNTRHLLETAANSQEELPSRIRVLDELAATSDPAVNVELKKLFNRTKPEPVPMKNWDPVAAERVVDLHIVKALYILGDDSELDRLVTLIRQAGYILTGQDDELNNATSVILSIGRVELIRQLTMMTSDNELRAVKNAVIILNQLDLPHAPVGGEVTSVFQPPTQEFTFEIYTLKQELETLTELSKGQIVMSGGTKSFLISNDYDRGAVKRENITLSEIIEQDLSILDFDYYVTGKTVVICTHNEAGQRWRDWWQKYGRRLAYYKESSRFIITQP